MKRFVVFCILVFFPILSLAQIEYIDAAKLTLVGKVFENTPNPYHRLDTQTYPGLNEAEQRQAIQSSGIAVAFRTDSPRIHVKAEFAKLGGGGSTGPNAQQGFDLYIKKDGSWRWAGTAHFSKDGEKALIYYNDCGMCDCLVYLPLFSSVNLLQIGIRTGDRIESIKNPFRHRIAVFGSSFTQGYGCSRSAMSYTAQLSRFTGIQFINFGFSGRSMLQKYFAEALADAQVDAYIFDAFSNPSAEIIEERLFAFIETIQAANPGKPLIFIKTLYREWRSFNSDVDRKETAKMEMADYMMKTAMKKYKDVYYVTSTNATDENHDTTVDGTHPGDYGYKLMAQSIKEPILKILAKYGIK